ncbi:hypothetical protein ERO13_A05G111200v2 [Gossypium hirsutum]|uniref:GDP-L-galactose phosphorylase 1 n=1 Tax=Gossypium mustelinum TaxID=34275 RepID=A0A5D2Z546_GOSMU|nr:hypothetical protein ERO13_A05G111200v2 [Gossypium hirsutum]TYJ33652.1 hypothetical protein E1A91_A05G117900v1 [Gossypium mustelinum]
MVTVKWLEYKSFLAKNGKSKQLEDSFSFLQGMNFPIYCFGSQSIEEDTSFEGISCIIEEEQNILDAVLLSQWEDRMLKDCFKYDVTTSEIKVVTGKMKFLCQLNEGQITDHLSKSEGNTLHELDPFAFDCVKHQEELLFCLANSKKAKSELIPSASGDKICQRNQSVTPIEYGHVYLVPCASNRLYRFLDARSTEIITRLAAEINNQSFRIFYNCYIPNRSGVYFEACYFPHPLPVEFRPAGTLFGASGRRGIHICSIIDYPIKTLSFQTTQNLKILAAAISEICFQLEEKNIQYNLMISDSGKKIFLFLQKTCAASHAISAWECGGYFLFRNRYQFDQVTEDAMINRLSSFSLDDNDFEAVKQLCCRIASKFDV